MNEGDTQVPSELAKYAIEQLVGYALHQGLLGTYDADYGRNQLLELYGMDENYQGEETINIPTTPADVLHTLIDYGYKIGLIPDNSTTYRDLLDARIMGLLTPRPSEVIAKFQNLSESEGIAAATDDFYQLSVASNYIRMDRVVENLYWTKETIYGEMEITINLSKPEKNPKEIAMAKLLPPPIYPKCQLCRENVGYAGRLNHPGRQNLRVIPLELNEEAWFFQYSPYVYYNEHSIVFHHDHVPMKLTKSTFKRLLDFVGKFPHYFIGSNADLPIVGGSILTHDHFQAGRHVFPLEKAKIDANYGHTLHPGVQLSVVDWPMSVLRLNSQDPDALLHAADEVYSTWKEYEDADSEIIPYTHSTLGEDAIPHHTVTPIVRRGAEGSYEMDLVLRSNLTSAEHPDGIYHPHQDMHHIKKENIGLIEVMGLAILPGRLKDELGTIALILAGNEQLYNETTEGLHPELSPHLRWIKELILEHGNTFTFEAAEELLRQEVGRKFSEILAHAGVFKRTDAGRIALHKFITHLGYSKSS
ncbi:UDP-glucose--hexose-1-phosphate uridylyltransferase [Paenibacillus shirakamiensis]|nr:UDP-glucose--hexose-1-phosphate uridylyltransferase [Paenibacillus shirakamiensis]